MPQWMDAALMSPAGCFLVLDFGQQNFGEVSTDIRLGRLTSCFQNIYIDIHMLYIYMLYI